MTENQNPMESFEILANETAAIAVVDPAKTAMVNALTAVGVQIGRYNTTAAQLIVANKADADAAALVLKNIAADEKTITDALENEISGLHKLHKRWTAFRGLFLDPLATAKRTIKSKVIDWQLEQERIAEAARAKAQAAADEAARKEREKLEREAAKLKTPELKAAKLEAAAAVITPVVAVEAPKASGLRVQKRWKVKAFDMTAMGIPADIQGYVTIETGKLERAKAANTMLTVKGVEFILTTI